MALRAWIYQSFALIAGAAVACSAHAQDGAYDPSFGDVGRTWIHASPGNQDEGTKMIRLPGGNLFIAGGCSVSPCAAWLTPSGTLATGYGLGGKGTAWFGAYVGWPDVASSYPGDVAAFADGRVVFTLAIGNANSWYLALLRANGTGLDPSVGNGAGYAPSVGGQLVRVTPQQQVIVVGGAATSPLGIVVARYDSTFHLDTSFGTGGSTTINFADDVFYPVGMTLQRDGKIVVIGQIGTVSNKIGIIRLTAGGSPDPAFGIASDGRLESVFGSLYGAVGKDIVEDKKGRLVLAGYGYVDDSLGSRWLVNRLLSGGAQDPAFNGGHAQQFTIISSSTSKTPQPCCVALQSDNRIVVAGTMDRPDPVYKYFAIARFTDAGAFDSTFGGGGQAYGDMSTQAPNALNDAPNAMVISNGGIVVGGYSSTSTEERFVAAKARIDLLLAADFE